MKVILILIVLGCSGYLEAQNSSSTSCLKEIIGNEPIKIIQRQNDLMGDSVIVWLIKKDCIRFNDRKAIRKTNKNRRDSDYYQLLLVAVYDDFYLYNYRHYGYGTHGHIEVFSKNGKLLCEYETGKNPKQSFTCLMDYLRNCTYSESKCN